MNNNRLLPFSRNRYYKGKMLTSVDFEAEQSYMNDKRRFLNAMVTGSGIVCGLNVVSLDDQSLLIESGMAIDETGREIVVENSVVKKLSTIAGFEELKTNDVCLCIRYAETETQPVYAINRQDSEKEYENNRIEEGYELFLKDIESLEEDYEPETEFYTGGTLLENKDYKVQLKLPSYICAGQYVKIDLQVEKLSDGKANLYYEGVIQTPALSTMEGGQELSLLLENISLNKGQRIVREYWMLAQSEETPDTSIMFKAGSGKALVNGVEQPIISQLNCKIVIVDESTSHLSARQTGNVNIELRGMRSSSDRIRLANLTIVKTGAAYLIETVDEKNVKNYVPTMRDAWKRLEYSSYFSKRLPMYEGNTPSAAVGKTDITKSNSSVNMPRLETGIVEIPIGENAKKGDICYSGEIMHGLGAGNVYVEVGYEYLEENAVSQNPTKTTIYGNPELFEKDRINVAAETAVKVLNDKGSFVVAVKLLQNVRMLVLTYRWVAIRYDSENLQEEIETTTNQSISAVTPTIVLGTKESYFFQVKYNNMKACSISYELTESSSGEITSDGIYTAPSKEGVYEIKIFCTDKPLICTYAYAIVKKKAVDEIKEDKAQNDLFQMK
ncbi:MAG: hypothetical protein MR531_01935 [Lachnospiraceae bacterium]|nr:hypothetical protein [Lachnospiraceae bacterium]